MSDAYQVAGQVIGREIGKLNKLSEKNEPLSGAQLEQLAALVRCLKMLRSPAAVPELGETPDDGPPSPEQLTDLLNNA